MKRKGDGPHTGGLGAGFPALRSREMAKAFTDREHTDTIKCSVNLFSGWKGPMGPIYCGVQGLTCSPPSYHSHFPHPFPWDCGPDGVPAHTGRLLDDEILTLVQATENASLSLTSTTPASAAGHVSRAAAGRKVSLLMWDVAPGWPEACSTDTLARLHEQEGSTPVQGINPAQRPWGRSAAELIYLVHFGGAAEVHIPNLSMAGQLSRLGRQGSCFGRRGAPANRLTPIDRDALY